MIRVLLATLLAMSTACSQASSGFDDLVRGVLESDRPGQTARDLAAMAVVGERTRALTLAVRLAQSGSHARRSSALSILACLGPEYALEHGVRRFSLHRDPVWSVRRDVFRALSGIDANIIHGVISEGTRDAIWNVRLSAVHALGRSRSPLSPDLVRDLGVRLDDRDPAVAEAAAVGLSTQERMDQSTANRLFRGIQEREWKTRTGRAVWRVLHRVPLQIQPEEGRKYGPMARLLELSHLSPSRKRCSAIVEMVLRQEIRDTLGGENVAILVQGILEDPGLDEVLKNLVEKGPVRKLLTIILSGDTASSQKWPLRSSMLLEIAAGRSPAHSVLQAHALGMTPPGSRLLEEMLMSSLSREGVFDREREGLLLRAFQLVVRSGRSDVSQLLQACRGHRIPALRAEALLESWKMGDREIRRTVVSELDKFSRLHGALAVAIAREMMINPEPHLYGVFLSMAKRGASRSMREVGVEGLISLDSPRARETLWRIAGGREGDPGIWMARRHLARTGHSEATAQIIGMLREQDVVGSDLLAAASAIDSGDVANILMRRVRADSLGAQTLAASLGIIAGKVSRSRLTAFLEEILTVPSPGVVRKIRGSVWERVLDQLRLPELVPVTWRAIDREVVTGDLEHLLVTLVDLSGGTPFRAGLARWLVEHAKTGGAANRTDLIPALGRIGDGNANAILVEAATRSLGECLGASGDTMARREALETLGVVVNSLASTGDPGALRKVAGILLQVEGQRRRALFEERVPAAVLLLEVERLIAASLDGVPDYRVLEDALEVESRAIRMPAPCLAWEVVNEWSMRRWSLRHDPTPCLFLGKSILAASDSLRGATSPAMMTLASRLASRGDQQSLVLARDLLVLSGRNGSPPGPGRSGGTMSAYDHSRDVMVPRFSANHRHWLLRSVQVPLSGGGEVPLESDPSLRDVDGSIMFVEALLRAGRPAQAGRVLRDLSRWAGLNPRVLMARCHLLLFTGRNAEALSLASRVGTALGRRSQRRDFGKLEARAMWWLGRRDAAILVLRRVGVRPDDRDIDWGGFPGIEETSWFSSVVPR